MKASDLILSRYKPAERTVRILLDGTLAADLDRLQAELDRVRRTELKDPQGLATKTPAVEKRIDELRTRADEATVDITLRAMSGEQFDQLKLRFPPTQEQWDNYKSQAAVAPLFATPPEVDGLGMAPELIGLSLVAVDSEPVEPSADEGHKLWATLHDGARGDLLAAAWEVNGRSSSLPFSETGTDTTPSTGQESITPANTESPSPSTQEGS